MVFFPMSIMRFRYVHMFPFYLASYTNCSDAVYCSYWKFAATLYWLLINYLMNKQNGQVLNKLENGSRESGKFSILRR